ncbi:hypothetical protein AK812_SmicGene37041 [Symbiodinium microadriaticum]|uniref:Uncharacterized protein n=1 Tax=Symbiodinium microadriaticum TaxID=2951 RepID=A0A1Q9CHA0_SYMMI|nr:hypothetical protein AK812_SmicGene37041 [Symbiodinium microadriaticum]
MASDLQPNAAGCQSFESNVFRHADALDPATESRLRLAEEARRTTAVAKTQAKDSTSRWFFGEAQDDVEESGSETDGEFRMFAGEDGAMPLEQ